jgi:bifunctional DNA-binding transcriptional regulator/antitoxin component of YhaV-PrlF toxin-antitoxin module
MTKRVDTWDTLSGMKIVTLTRGGQVSIPVEFRRDWTSNRIMVQETDRGLLLRPVPDDPLSAALGSLGHKVKDFVSAEDSMREHREEELAAEERKYGRTE